MSGTIKGVGSNDFSKAVRDILSEYGAEATVAVQEAVKEEANEVKDEIKRNAKARGWSSKYVNGFTVSEKSTRLGMQSIVHNKTEYRLIHLLEFGHRVVNPYGNKNNKKTTSSPAFPHVAPAVEHLEEDLINKIGEKLQ